ATEAQAMGTPVIATDIGAPPETVLSAPRGGQQAGTGWLVPPSDPDALAEAIAAALAHPPQERARMGERAPGHVVAAFSLDAMKRATLKIYDALLDTRLAGSR